MAASRPPSSSPQPIGSSALFRLSRLGAHGIDPLVEVRFGPGLLPAVTLLESADQLVAVPRGVVPVVVGELAPGTLGLALELLPASLEDVCGGGHEDSFQWFPLDRPLRRSSSVYVARSMPRCGAVFSPPPI